MAVADRRPSELRVLDGPAARRWAAASLAALLDAQIEIDRLNVFPIADSDTGANLVRTLRAAVDGLVGEPGQGLGVVFERLAGAALLGACGNSGTILAQLLRGFAEAAADAGVAGDGGDGGEVDALGPGELASALGRAATLAREAVAHPVEGTILTVADAAAAAALTTARSGGDLVVVTRSAHEAASAALAATPAQLPALGGRRDAGGLGLVVVLAALADVVSGAVPRAADGPAGHADQAPPMRPVEQMGQFAGSHEVMYLLETTGDETEALRMADLRAALEHIGDSVAVAGASPLWQVHLHTPDVGAAVEAGFAAGRAHQVRITALVGGAVGADQPPNPPNLSNASTLSTLSNASNASNRSWLGGLAVVAIVDGAGVAELLTASGARVIEPAALATDLASLLASLSSAPATTGDDGPAGPIAVLPGSVPALAVAEMAAREDPRIRVVRSRSAVQAIAALAVHDPAREPGADLLAMATAAAGCRDGLVEVAHGDGMTSAGICRAGDVLGHVGGDVAVIGAHLEQVAGQVLDLLLGGGGELVTLVAGRPDDPRSTGLADRVAAELHRRRPDVDITTYDGGQPASYLVVGVE